MGLSPAVMLEALDDAIADTPWWRPNKVALELVGSPTVLGERGRRTTSNTVPPTYGFTRKQCQRMRAKIAQAARDDYRTGAYGGLL